MAQTGKLPSCPIGSIYSNATYNCTNPYPDCTNSQGYDAPSLFYILHQIAACPNDTRLFSNPYGVPALTAATCVRLVGSRGSKLFPSAGIWLRLTTWKFPLLQLIAAFPRPPLTLVSQWFTLVHLLGNPISTIRSLLLKFASCQDRVNYWRNFDEDFARILDYDSKGYYSNGHGAWKELALIVDTCDEWGRDKGDDVRDFLANRLRLRSPAKDTCETPRPKLDDSCVAPGSQSSGNGQLVNDVDSLHANMEDKICLLHGCRTAAYALAADRSTKLLPIIVAQALFIGSIGNTFRMYGVRTTGVDLERYDTESHEDAFGALYFWILPAVLFSSVIGVSQTENAIPRILSQLKATQVAEFPECEDKLPIDFLYDTEGRENLNTNMRERNGGLYSWQPRAVRNRFDHDARCEMQKPAQSRRPGKLAMTGSLARRRTSRRTLVPTLFAIFSCYLVARGISAGTPPVGFGCVCIKHTTLFLVWLFAGLVDYIHIRKRDHLLRRTIMALEVVSMLASIGGMIVLPMGVFRRCWCSTQVLRGADNGFFLPDLTAPAGVSPIPPFYSGIASACIVFQVVVIPLFIFWQYSGAFKVYLQRDDTKSNWDWLEYLRSNVTAVATLTKRGLKYVASLAQIRTIRRQFSSSRSPGASAGQPAACSEVDIELEDRSATAHCNI